MDPLSNHQNLIDLDNCFNYIHQADPLLIRDDTRELVSPTNFSQLGFPYFDPIDEDLRLWDLPLLTSNEDQSIACHVTSGEEINHEQISPFKQDQNYFSELRFPYFDPIDEYLSLWECLDSDHLPLLTHNNDESIACHVSSGEASTTTDCVVVDHGGQNEGKRLRSLELEEIEKYFEMPIAMAAKELNVGLTMLKKRCRELNIKRWPHRKLKSLKSLIHNVKELGLKEELEMLEEQKRMIEKLPEMDLTQRTKKLRQSCFKANYKKRRFDYSLY